MLCSSHIAPATLLLDQQESALAIADEEGLVTPRDLPRNDGFLTLYFYPGAQDFDLIAGRKAELLAAHDSRRRQMNFHRAGRALHSQVPPHFVLADGAGVILHCAHRAFHSALGGNVVKRRALLAWTWLHAESQQ